MGGGTRERDKSIDILKGIAMILIVTGHAYTPHRDWIYLFHVSVFFIASGYCWNKRICTGNEWIRYIARKIKELYIPYILYNCMFILLNNLFVKLSIYSDNPELLSLPLTNNLVYPQRLTTILSTRETAVLLAKTVTLQFRPQVGGATWFITVLLAILIVHVTVEYLTRRLFEQTETASVIVNTALLVAMLLIPQFATAHGIHLHWIFARFPYPYAVFLLGILLRKAERRYAFQKIYNYFGTCIICFVLLSFLYVKGIKVELASGKVNDPISFMIGSILGWFMLLYLSKLIMPFRKVGNTIAYIGTHTIPILYLHFLAFKVVSLIYVLSNNKPYYYIASFPVIFSSGFGYRILYIVAGIGFPLLAQNIVNMIVSFIRRKD